MEIGGAQVLTVGLLNEMCATNDVALIIINNIWSKELLGRLDPRIEVFFLNRKQGNRSIWPLLKLNAMLYKLKPDIIHCHEPNMAKIIKVSTPKLFHTIHDVGIDTVYYKFYDELVAISEAVFNDVLCRYTKEIKKIYNGIPISSFTKRETYFLGEADAIKLVQVSRLMHAKKGQDILIRAVQKLVFEYGFPLIHLDIIGMGGSYDYLNELIKELKLTNNVKLLGEKGQNWIIATLCTYHILIQPSRYEGFGLTVVEGFAAGLPVLTSDIDGPAEIINGLPAGFLFNNEDVEGCANQLRNIITLYRQNMIKSLITETLPLIESKYSMAVCAHKYLKEYEKSLS